MNELILGIETSCDETGVALVRDGELLADVTATSMDEYARFGGIIPEIASRAHLESFIPTLDAALGKAGVELDDVDAIAVTAGPGLVGPLTIGMSAAKASAPASHLKDLPQPGIAESGTVDNAGIGELRDVCSRFADTLAEASDQFSKACGHLSVAVEGAFVEMESVDTGTTEQFNHLTVAVPE